MLQSLDAAFREFDGVEGAVPVRRFTLIPTHACGGSMKAVFTGGVMGKLVSKIKKSHPAFYRYVRSLPEYDQRKLYTYFRYEKKNGWERGRQVRSDGVELHLLYEKNNVYMSNRKPKKQKLEYRSITSDFDLPKEVQKVPEADIAALDKGYHNLYSVVRIHVEWCT